MAVPDSGQTILDEFDAAKKLADEARAVLLARLEAIKAERKSMNARLNAEAKEIKRKLGLGKTRGPRTAKPDAKA